MAQARSLLLLGGSAQQVVAIEAARACGYRTVVCDYLPDNPGQHYADAFYLVSTTDCEAVLEVARAEHVEGIVAYSSDPAAPTAAYVAEALGLPTNPFESVEILSVKTLLREYLQKEGFPCPRAVGISADASLESALSLVSGLSFPIVVKPTDSSGSKGVTKLESTEGLADALAYARPFGRNGILIAEEFIECTAPHIVGGDIFVKDGRICFWGLMNCLRPEEYPFSPQGESFPAQLTADEMRRVRKVLQDFVTSLGLRFGELNVEVIIGPGGVPYILELGARAGGGMIPVELSDVSGIDLVRANVMCAMGDDPGDLDWDSVEKCVATYLFHAKSEGAYDGYTLSEAARAACYREVSYAKPGDPVGVFENASAILGVLFFRFDSPDEMNAFMDRIDEHVAVNVI